LAGADDDDDGGDDVGDDVDVSYTVQATWLLGTSNGPTLSSLYRDSFLALQIWVTQKSFANNSLSSAT